MLKTGFNFFFSLSSYKKEHKIKYFNSLHTGTHSYHIENNACLWKPNYKFLLCVKVKSFKNNVYGIFSGYYESDILNFLKIIDDHDYFFYFAKLLLFAFFKLSKQVSCEKIILFCVFLLVPINLVII